MLAQGSIGHHRLVAGAKPAQSSQCSLQSRFMDTIARRSSEVRLARFPLDLAFTARNIVNHPIAGGGYQRASEGGCNTLLLSISCCVEVHADEEQARVV